MDIIGNLISQKTEVEIAIVSSYKTNSYYIVESGNISYTAKSIIGSLSIGTKVIILNTNFVKYIIGIDKGTSYKRKEVIVNG